MTQLQVTRAHWPLPAACIEDFMDRKLEQSGGASAKNLFARLKWLVVHLQAPLKLEHVCVPAGGKSCRQPSQQAVVAEPCMIRAIWDAFREDVQLASWRRVLTAVAVCASVKPLRFAHALRSRPVARTKWWAAFWAYQGKVRTDGVVRGGFRWFVPLVTPTLRQAVDVLWTTWAQIWQSERRQQHPSQCMVVDAHSLLPVKAAVFNRVLQECVAPVMKDANVHRCTSYSLRRFQPTLLDVRAADMPERMALGNWTSKEGRADKVMPLRYSGAKVQAELQVGVVQALCTASMVQRCATWEDCRLWWLSEGAANEKQWRQRFADLLQDSDIEWAAGSDFIAGHVCEPRFCVAGHAELAAKPAVDSLSVGCVSWITSSRSAALLHMNFEGRPRCTWKQRQRRAKFKREPVVLDNLLEAVATGRAFCKSCLTWLSLPQLRELEKLDPSAVRR